MLFCQETLFFFCAKPLSANSLKHDMFLRTFPIGFDLQGGSVFRLMNAIGV